MPPSGASTVCKAILDPNEATPTTTSHVSRNAAVQRVQGRMRGVDVTVRTATYRHANKTTNGAGVKDTNEQNKMVDVASSLLNIWRQTRYQVLGPRVV